MLYEILLTIIGLFSPLQSFRSPFTAAAEKGRESIVQLLLNNNADPNLVDGVSTLTWCSKSISVSLVLVTFVVI